MPSYRLRSGAHASAGVEIPSLCLFEPAEDESGQPFQPAGTCGEAQSTHDHERKGSTLRLQFPRHPLDPPWFSQHQLDPGLSMHCPVAEWLFRFPQLLLILT